jgi:inorganic pyrophosphatase
MKPTDFIGRNVRIKIDRPLGSRHPEHGFISPVNDGYLPDTQAPDGQELDAYVLGVFVPLEAFKGRCMLCCTGG